MEVTVAILEELTRTIKAIGMDNTINALRLVQNTHASTDCSAKDKVLSHVSAEMNIPVNEFIDSGKRTDEIRIAIGLAAFFMVKTYDLSLKEIVPVIKRKKSAVSKYVNMVDRIVQKQKTDSPFENMLKVHYQRINLLISKTQIITN